MSAAEIIEIIWNGSGAICLILLVYWLFFHEESPKDPSLKGKK